jgi:hypothetical protein
VLDMMALAARKLTDYPGEPSASDSFPTWVGSAQIGFTSNSGGNEQIYQVATSGTGGQNLTVTVAIEGWYGPN